MHIRRTTTSSKPTILRASRRVTRSQHVKTRAQRAKTAKALGLKIAPPKKKGVGFLPMRCAVVTKDTKTSVLISSKVVKPELESPLAKEMLKACKEVDSYREGEIILDSNGSPEKIITNTPSKSVLRKIGDNGIMAFFSNNPEAAQKFQDSKVVETLSPSHRFFSSSPQRNIKEPESKIKIQTIKITAAKLKRVKKQIDARREKGKSARSCQQSQVMVKRGVSSAKGSATTYGEAAGIAPDQESEWLHLIAHRFMGNIAQDENNLIWGTKDSNTDGLFIESEILNYLIKKYPNGLILEVKTHLIPKTQFSSTLIEYNVRLPKFELPFTINPYSKVQPLITNKDFLHGFTKAMVTIHKENYAPSASPGAPAKKKILKPVRRPLFQIG